LSGPEILCAACRVPVAVREGDGELVATCPKCGICADLASAEAEADAALFDAAERSLDRLGRGGAGRLNRSRFVYRL
jgi:uncharacterized Zn finger protein (UPF0148 family)